MFYSNKTGRLALLIHTLHHYCSARDDWLPV
jgi:hypothetical protein